MKEESKKYENINEKSKRTKKKKRGRSGN